MAPQYSIPVAANVLGTLGTVLWSVQLVPQIWHNWKQKKTDGLPGLMMFTWAILPMGIYAIVQNFNIPLQLQPQAFSALSLVSWSQILIYNNGWRTWTASLLTLGIATAFGGVQVLLVFTLRGPYNHGVGWPITLIGILAVILLSAGLLPPYFEMWKRNGRCIGINWIFLGTDWMGAFISLIALVAQNTFDYLGGFMYISVLLLETGIFTTHIIWRIRTRELHQLAKAEGVDFDDLEEAKKYQVPSDREIVVPLGSSPDLEPGNTDLVEGHVETVPARRRSSVSGAVGYVLPPAVPIEGTLKVP